MFSRLDKGCPGTRQNNPELSKCSRHGVDIHSATVLFHDDVMAHRKTKSGAFTGRFGCEEGIEYLLFYFGRYSGAIVTDADLDLVTKILRRGRPFLYEIP
jgi:hypothetical protein